MALQLSGDDGRQSLEAHVAAKGWEVHQKFPVLGWKELLQLLEDRGCVRYPCEIAFDATPLAPGEMSYPSPKGDRPEDGFTIYVHPYFMTELSKVPHLVLYQLVLVNYGEFASAEDAEIFGATALGLPKEEYYQILCELADTLSGAPPA